jgi:hypothetical protein
MAAVRPKKLDWVASACLPLVTVTAWELLEEHFNLIQDDPSGKQKEKSIIIISESALQRSRRAPLTPQKTEPAVSAA